MKTKPESVPVAVHCDPQVMGGTPVFVGTRVPFQTLLDYLEGGEPIAEFLEDFPTVSREQAVAALEQAKDALFARARPRRAWWPWRFLGRARNLCDASDDGSIDRRGCQGRNCSLTIHVRGELNHA